MVRCVSAQLPVKAMYCQWKNYGKVVSTVELPGNQTKEDARYSDNSINVGAQ